MRKPKKPTTKAQKQEMQEAIEQVIPIDDLIDPYLLTTDQDVKEMLK